MTEQQRQLPTADLDGKSWDEIAAIAKQSGFPTWKHTGQTTVKIKRTDLIKAIVEARSGQGGAA